MTFSDNAPVDPVPEATVGNTSTATTVLVRVTGLPHYDSVTLVDGTVIDRNGVEVPTDQVTKILTEAQQYKIPVEAIYKDTEA